MKRALLKYDGQAIWSRVSEDGTGFITSAGDSLPLADAVWLPPVDVGVTVFALGLNYADHNRELGFSPKQAAPLIFLKGRNCFVGHQGFTPRPVEATQMHPECELVAIIGQRARRVTRADALNYVAGYTIANDYAIRNYLENYYRPNARVKNRDATTPLGPWVVDARDVGDPQSLRIETRVNGAVVQRGSTADMIMDVASLIAYLSETQTLLPGDMILTGTPQGVHFVQVGDVVETEIEGVGTLVNTLVAA